MPYIRKTVDLFISEPLVKILEEIKNNSVIAEMLLKRNNRDDLIEDHVDYLSISDADETKISYLNKDKIEKIGPGQDIWGASRRFYARPGAVMNKIFKNLNSRDIEIFNNLYKSALLKLPFEFKIISGEEIRKYYLVDRYAYQSGSLGNSCMKYIGCQSYFDIYIDNDPTIKMLIMLDNNGFLLGRSLLWNFNHCLDSYKIMDRIYTVNDDEYSYHFKKWAIGNGYMYKHEQKWNNTLHFELNGKKFEQKFAIKLEKFIYQRYPYLDTFKFFDAVNGVLYNYIPNDSVKIIGAPDGRYYNSDFLSLDFVNNLYYNTGETVAINYLDGKINPYSRLRTHESNTHFSKVNNMSILRKDSFYCDEIDDYIFNKDLDHLNNNSLIEEMKLRYKQRMEKIKLEESKMKRMPSLSRRPRPSFDSISVEDLSFGGWSTQAMVYDYINTLSPPHDSDQYNQYGIDRSALVTAERDLGVQPQQDSGDDSGELVLNIQYSAV